MVITVAVMSPLADILAMELAVHVPARSSSLDTLLTSPVNVTSRSDSEVPILMDPPSPVILGAWHFTSDRAKQARLAEHLRYGAEHGVLDQLEQFLRALGPDEWTHEGDR